MNENDQAFLDSMKKINFIASHVRLRGDGIKESPVPAKHIVKVDMPKTGGIFTYFAEDPYPQKGFPHSDTVEAVDVLKKNLMALAEGGIGIFLFQKARRAYVKSLWRTIWKYRLKPERYCAVVQEVRRAYGKVDPFIDIVSMILEFDDAYRYRFQWALAHFKPYRFKSNAVEELKTLARILEAHEADPQMQRKWRTVRTLLNILYIQRGVRKGVQAFFERLDLPKCLMDEADTYHARTKTLFNWS